MSDVEQWVTEVGRPNEAGDRAYFLTEVIFGKAREIDRELARLRAERDAYRTAWEAVRSTFNDMKSGDWAYDSDVVDELVGLFDKYGALEKAEEAEAER